ncbi:MAG: bifunctional ornithine acetyltransferase/N-acetylglutamate synthase, partial [Nitrospinae bacterium]|nr:bifunctional ornithine acetyltransferase/N-acetylglutamate synthase [Nitrospinota bacterium]
MKKTTTRGFRAPGFRVPGFKASGISCGIKANGIKDLALIFAESPATAAGVFTKNAVVSPTVTWCRKVLKSSKTFRAVLVNSGNANACTGPRGMEDCRETAVRLAKKGFPLTWGLYLDADGGRERFAQYPSTMNMMYKSNGEQYQPGETWRQPDLAKVLKRIQKQGRDGFYRGPTAQKLADFMAANGGLITENDLAQYEAIERQPIHGTYNGYDVYAMPPPSSGGIALVEMLNILEGYDLKSVGHNSAQYMHLLTEAMRRAFADRAQFIGDPDFNENLPIE